MLLSSPPRPWHLPVTESVVLPPLRSRIMPDLQDQIAQLESEAADCELMGSLSSDPEVRAVNRKRATELQEQAWALRDSNPDRRTA